MSQKIKQDDSKKNINSDENITQVKPFKNPKQKLFTEKPIEYSNQQIA